MRLVILSLALTASGCGLGGIVDNGEKDDGDGTPTGRDSAAQIVDVLGAYEVALPDDWQVKAGLSADMAEVAGAAASVTFTRGRIPCTGEPRANGRGVMTVKCDDLHTLLLPTPDDPVTATLSTRTPETEAVLDSFQRKGR